MDRRERIEDPVEGLRAALDGKQAEMWTALPGLVESFDPQAMTVAVQPAIQGMQENEAGKALAVNLPLLVDVPVVFPSGGGFTLTHPIKPGDACLVVFASRCIDGWWQSGGVAQGPDNRMHDLSDGFALVGPRARAKTLSPAVDTQRVQLRTDDGQAHVTMSPDYTILAQNPAAKVELSPGGDVTMEASTSINLTAPVVNIQANSLSMSGLGGGDSQASFTGSISSTGDQVAGGISQMGHRHGDTQPGSGTTGVPQ
jgi:phage baseplate assembly protein gpV